MLRAGYSSELQQLKESWLPAKFSLENKDYGIILTVHSPTKPAGF